MKKLLSGRLTWVKVTESISLIILGILIAVFGGLYSHQLSIAITISLAVFLAIDGIITLVEFWLEPKKNITASCLVGGIMVAGAVLLIICAVKQIDLAATLAQFISILLITFGVIFLIKMIIQAVYHGPVGWIIVHTLVFVLASTLGITSIIYATGGNVQTLEIILIVLGIAITVLGAIDLVLTIMAYRKKVEEEKKNGKAKAKKKTPTVDAEVDDDDKVVVKGKKSKKKITKKKETKPKEIAMDDESKTKSDDSKSNNESSEEVVEAEVVDPEK